MCCVSHGIEQTLAGSYRPRDPQTSDYHRCTQDHFERLEMVWDDRYERKYGFWRPYVMDVIRRYLECGDPPSPALESFQDVIIDESYSQLPQNDYWMM
jgi:hypothetical protein